MSFVIGKPPILEVSSVGDWRFSSFRATLKCFGNKSIEEIYQSSKIIEGAQPRSFWDRKGRKAKNIKHCAKLYSILWDLYIDENPHLIDTIMKYKGFSDQFGKEDSQCQAKEIYRIQQEILKGEF